MALTIILARSAPFKVFFKFNDEGTMAECLLKPEGHEKHAAPHSTILKIRKGDYVSLRDHLFSFHKMIAQAVSDEIDKGTLGNPNKVAQSYLELDRRGLGPMDIFLEHLKKGGKAPQSRAMLALARWIAEAGISFNMCDKQSFKDVVRTVIELGATCGASAVLPGIHTIIDTALPVLDHILSGVHLERLRKAEVVCGCTDGWTASSGTHFVALSFAYICRMPESWSLSVVPTDLIPVEVSTIPMLLLVFSTHEAFALSGEKCKCCGCVFGDCIPTAVG